MNVGAKTQQLSFLYRQLIDCLRAHFPSGNLWVDDPFGTLCRIDRHRGGGHPPTDPCHTLENYTPLASGVRGMSCTWYPSFLSCITSVCRLRFKVIGLGAGPRST
jgi:hypothetical protein